MPGALSQSAFKTTRRFKWSGPGASRRRRRRPDHAGCAAIEYPSAVDLWTGRAGRGPLHKRGRPLAAAGKSAGAPRHTLRYRPRAKITYGIIALPSVPREASGCNGTNPGWLHSDRCRCSRGLAVPSNASVVPEFDSTAVIAAACSGAAAIGMVAVSSLRGPSRPAAGRPLVPHPVSAPPAGSVWELPGAIRRRARRQIGRVTKSAPWPQTAPPRISIFAGAPA